MPTNLPTKILLFPIIGAVSVFLLLFAFAKWGPSFPISVILSSNPTPFTVTAEGKASAAPDIAEVNLGISAAGSTVSQVQSQANQIINKVTASIKNLGIADKDIRTTSYNINPEYAPVQITPQPVPLGPGGIPPSPTDLTKPANPRITGYMVNINMVIKVRDFNKINQVIDTATANGANQVGGLTFTLDDASKVQVEARKDAIAKAKQKASELASQTGITLGKITSISESTNDFPRPYALAAADKSSGEGQSSTQIQPGQSEVSVTVTLTYETR